LFYFESANFIHRREGERNTNNSWEELKETTTGNEKRDKNNEADICNMVKQNHSSDPTTIPLPHYRNSRTTTSTAAQKYCCHKNQTAATSSCYLYRFPLALPFLPSTPQINRSHANIHRTKLDIFRGKMNLIPFQVIKFCFVSLFLLLSQCQVFSSFDQVFYFRGILFTWV
jgi:hypothetical protein